MRVSLHIWTCKHPIPALDCDLTTALLNNHPYQAILYFTLALKCYIFRASGSPDNTIQINSSMRLRRHACVNVCIF